MPETTQNNTKFTADMSVRQILDMHPEAGLVLTGYHLGGCSHCGVNQFETLQQVCNAYGIPIDAILSSLNDLLEN
ncbi:MAG: DUF1858 domain-containing protein [Spirochaetia bacterium]|nr:DUF1858 domain-containing protein [Spirochaetia bacterium]